MAALSLKQGVVGAVLAMGLGVCAWAQTTTPDEAPDPAKIAAAANLLTVDVKDLDLKDALKIISQASGLNIITDKDVRAKVTITLKDVSWQTALENILRTNQLTHRLQNGIIRVMTPETITREEETTPLVTKIITLNFAKAGDLLQSLTKMLSSRGMIDKNITTNSLIITDTPDALRRVENLANQLDVRTPQVQIEALIMSVKLTDTEKMGLDFTTVNKDRPERKIVQALKAPSSILDLYYGKSILPNWTLSAQLNFYMQDKRVKILANPRVLTLDNLPAQIEITEQVPYTYVSQSTDGSSTMSSTQFKDIGIKLYVTPHITKDKFILLGVKAEQSFVASFVGSTNEPSIDSRKVDTNFMLKNGEAAVIGGLRKKDSTVTIDKIPILGDIPFLGKLFRKEIKEIVENELVIFIAPRVVETTFLTDQEADKLEGGATELRPSPIDNSLPKKKVLPRDKAIRDALNNMAPSSPHSITTSSRK